MPLTVVKRDQAVFVAGKNKNSRCTHTILGCIILRRFQFSSSAEWLIQHVRAIIAWVTCRSVQTCSARNDVLWNRGFFRVLHLRSVTFFSP